MCNVNEVDDDAKVAAVVNLCDGVRSLSINW